MVPVVERRTVLRSRSPNELVLISNVGEGFCSQWGHARSRPPSLSVPAEISHDRPNSARPPYPGLRSRTMSLYAGVCPSTNFRIYFSCGANCSMSTRTMPVMGSAYRTTRATASAFCTTRTTASAIWMRNVREFFLPDTECQRKCRPEVWRSSESFTETTQTLRGTTGTPRARPCSASGALRSRGG